MTVSASTSLPESAPDTFHALIESAPDAIVVVSGAGKIAIVNTQAETLFGYSRSELLGEAIEVLMPVRFREGHLAFREKYHNNPTVRPMGAALELLGRRKDGYEFPVEISLSPIDTRDGVLIASAIRDVSRRKEIEEQLRRSLNEKEILLKEVHHRVKNNLQVISSLLNIQSRHIDDKEAKKLCSDMRSRINSIALLYEKLYRSKDLAQIDVREYFNSLAEGVFQSFGISTEAIQLTVDVSDASLEIDSIINCGLIVNELVSNALKYAFIGRENGEIIVSLKMGAENKYILSVSDTGVGLPEGFEPGKLKTLGLQLVDTLAHELGGKMEFSSQSGARFWIPFNSVRK